jgi:predicted nucleic acid-binding protein
MPRITPGKTTMGKQRKRVSRPAGRQPPAPVLMIDTCVWLELAKDYNQKSLVKALETLVARGEIELMVPEIVVTELERNKARIVEESGRSLTAALKRAREAMNTFGDPRRKRTALRGTKSISSS